MKRTLVSLLLLVASLATSWAQVSSLAADPNLSETARSVGYGETLFVDGLQLSDANQSLRLRRFQVWADDARIIVHGESGDVQFPVPKNVYFTGTIEGASRSRAFMTVLEDGTVRGVINQEGRYWLFQRDDVDGMQVNELNDAQKQERSFSCDVDSLAPPPLQPKSGEPHHAVTETQALGGTGSYNVRVAVETDYEFYQKFGNATDATNYIGDILGYGSGIYGDEVDANLVVGDVSLWSAVGDPWTAADSNCGLFEFGGYWNQNNAGISRTIAHFFSGKSPNNGLAWVGVLCQSAFNYTTACMSPTNGSYGGAYGFTSGLDANFNINSPTVIWDIVAVTHEIGHNFNSPHTHCYAGLEGNASPIDQCYGSQSGANCYSGATSLPCGMASAGCGTLMSYCHLLSGGMANLSLTFGQGHPHGVAPERAPTRMNAHLVSQAGSFPSCITAACTAPSISASTGNQTRCAGSSVTFSVTASNATGYQWKKNNVDIGGATSSSYTIDPVSAGDAGSYTCSVSNACDSVTSTAATLTVNPVTAITNQSASMDRCVGTSATFSVTATGTGTLTYQWRKGGNNIGGATSSSYIINSVVQGDAGSYDCVVTGSCGSATSTAIALNVRTPLSISQQPGDLTKCVGQSATFTTGVTGGYSTISYQWYKGVTPVGTNSASLIIAAVTVGDAGNYSCTITDGCGSISTETHSLTVQSSPTLNAGPTAASRCVGDSVTFQVDVTGSGLGYQWQKDSSNIGGATSASYTIPSIVLGDDADYRCVITSNCGGLTTDQVHLTVTNGSFGMVAEPSSLIQGLELITLEAQVTCGGGSLTTTWTNLNTNQSYGTNVNPVTLPSYLEETTVFRAIANNGNTQISEDVVVLAAEDPEFLDLNGDGCNTIEDLLFILADWLDAGALDANGDGILNALDFLTINIEGPCP